MIRKRIALASALAVGVAVGAWAWADDKPAPQPAAAPDMAKVMAAWQAHMTPGAAHDRMKQMAGTFKADVKHRMAADAPEEASSGTCVNELILGGRYLKSDYSGDMMGQPFKGIQLLGYNNGTKRYESVWIDEMSTSMTVSAGEADESGKTITLNSEFFCVMTDGMRKARMVYAIADADSHTFEMFTDGPDGKEFRSMIITYTRQR
jgi:hypothetical protein